MIKIEKGIPVPPANNGRDGLNRGASQALRTMAVGDSIVVVSRHKTNGMANMQTSVAKQTGRKFSQRHIGQREDGMYEFRVWRVE